MATGNSNPGGSGKSGTSRRFDDQQAAPQKPVSTRSQDSINGDLIPKPQASTTDAGVGSVGNGNKPFKLGA